MGSNINLILLRIQLQIKTLLLYRDSDTQLNNKVEVVDCKLIFDNPKDSGILYFQSTNIGIMFQKINFIFKSSSEMTFTYFFKSNSKNFTLRFIIMFKIIWLF